MGANQKQSSKTVHYDDICYLCGHFSNRLLRIFPLNPDIILTTPASRRQVWYAVIAKLNLEIDVDVLASQLQFVKSERLLEVSYGTLPKFMMTILKRLGVKPHANHWYLDLYKVLFENPDIGPQLLNARNLDDLVPALAKFPRHLRNVSFASQFSNKYRVEEFLNRFHTIAHICNLKDPDHYLNSKIKIGCTPDRVLKLLVQEIEFSPPVLGSEDGLMYLGSVKAMQSVARRFNNCLETRIELAHCNAHQHYLLQLDEQEVVFSIQKLADNTWQFYEAEDKSNLFVDGAINERMHDILRKYNISTSERLSMIT